MRKGSHRRTIAIPAGDLRKEYVGTLRNVQTARFGKNLKGVTSSRKTRANRELVRRQATVKDADRIYVLSEGRVVEQGTHAQLIASEGEYAAMVQMQSLQTDLLALEEKRAPPPKPPTLEELELSQ